jgi:hypothetical protein
MKENENVRVVLRAFDAVERDITKSCVFGAGAS